MESRALHTRSPKSHSHKTNLEPKAPNFNPQTKESETEFVAFIEPLKGTLQGTLRVSLTEVTSKQEQSCGGDQELHRIRAASQSLRGFGLRMWEFPRIGDPYLGVWVFFAFFKPFFSVCYL